MFNRSWISFQDNCFLQSSEGSFKKKKNFYKIFFLLSRVFSPTSWNGKCQHSYLFSPTNAAMYAHFLFNRLLSRPISFFPWYTSCSMQNLILRKRRHGLSQMLLLEDLMTRSGMSIYPYALFWCYISTTRSGFAEVNLEAVSLMICDPFILFRWQETASSRA